MCGLIDFDMYIHNIYIYVLIDKHYYYDNLFVFSAAKDVHSDSKNVQPCSENAHSCSRGRFNLVQGMFSLVQRMLILFLV